MGTYNLLKITCHVRSSIYRKSKSNIKYPKNHSLSFDQRVPVIDQTAGDWEEYDPREDSFEVLS